jgi:hypothetical protein
MRMLDFVPTTANFPTPPTAHTAVIGEATVADDGESLNVRPETIVWARRKRTKLPLCSGPDAK